MKKSIILLILAVTAFIACNDPKDPPDEGFMKMARARMDSIKKVEAQSQLIPNNKSQSK